MLSSAALRRNNRVTAGLCLGRLTWCHNDSGSEKKSKSYRGD